MLIQQLITNLQGQQSETPQKPVSAKEIIDQEGLETPQESVKFLKHYKSHVEKTQLHQKNLKRVSNLFVFVGAFAFAFAVFSFMTPKAAPKPRLRLAPHIGDGQEQAQFIAADGSYDISSMASYASVFIWGLVLTKARSGLEASDSKDSSKVGGLLQRATSLIALICASALFKLIAVMTDNQKLEF